MASEKNSNAFLRTSVESPRRGGGKFKHAINAFNLPSDRFDKQKMRKSMNNEDIRTLALSKEKKYPHKRELKSLKSPRRMRNYGVNRSAMHTYNNSTSKAVPRKELGEGLNEENLDFVI